MKCEFSNDEEDEWRDRDDHESIKSDGLPHKACHGDPFKNKRY